MTSVPYYVIAVLLVYFLGYQGGYFPIRGRMAAQTTPGLNLPFLAGVLYHAFLPVVSIVITGMGGRALAMRGNSIRVMGEDFIRVARLRGLKSRTIAVQYVGRNALLPMYTNLMLAIGFMFGGAIILEEIFGYRGVGQLMFSSIGNRDLPLMMGCFLLITVTVVTAIFIADLTYGKLDPRVQSGERHEAF
jgi:peptide/nickel transport system permease protein